MKNMKVVLGLAIVFALMGCSTSKIVESQKEEVVSRIDNLSSRPDWLKESEPFQVRDGQVTSLGQASIPGDNRVEAAYRIAENNAKGAISGAIESRLDYVFQNAEEGTSLDATQARFIGAEASEIITSEMRLDKRYWEKVSSVSATGDRYTKYQVFVLVKMPEADFKKAIIEAARKRQGKAGLSTDFAKKVDAHWDNFVGGGK